MPCNFQKNKLISFHQRQSDIDFSPDTVSKWTRKDFQWFERLFSFKFNPAHKGNTYMAPIAKENKKKIRFTTESV